MLQIFLKRAHSVTYGAPVSSTEVYGAPAVSVRCVYMCMLTLWWLSGLLCFSEDVLINFFQLWIPLNSFQNIYNFTNICTKFWALPLLSVFLLSASLSCWNQFFLTSLLLRGCIFHPLYLVRIVSTNKNMGLLLEYGQHNGGYPTEENGIPSPAPVNCPWSLREEAQELLPMLPWHWFQQLHSCSGAKSIDLKFKCVWFQLRVGNI